MLAQNKRAVCITRSLLDPIFIGQASPRTGSARFRSIAHGLLFFAELLPREHRVLWSIQLLLVGSPGEASGGMRHISKMGATMRIWIGLGLLIASTVNAYAVPVPEIDGFSGMAAMGLIGSIAALIWERRRRE
jgi:hypothetical protein